MTVERAEEHGMTTLVIGAGLIGSQVARFSPSAAKRPC